MRLIGWIGLLHVLVLVGWMVVNIIFSMMNPASIDEGQFLAEAGIAYYSNFPGYLGFDHGSKALVMLISIVLPVALFIYLKRNKDFTLLNLIALIAGCIGFALYGVSLMLQATAVEYAFNLYSSTNDAYAQAFSLYLYDWSMLEGGFSVSIYILANLSLAAWIMIHSRGLYIVGGSKAFSVYGYVVALLLTIGHLISWFYLMQGNQNMHDFNEAVGLLFMIWILIVSIKMIRRKIVLEPS